MKLIIIAAMTSDRFPVVNLGACWKFRVILKLEFEFYQAINRTVNFFVIYDVLLKASNGFLKYFIFFTSNVCIIHLLKFTARIN